ncbi:sigma factor-like helix-turn-helix DNA-binding protein [Mycobacterium sp. ACS4331]|uniref:sigma factor-like helix-turn-helix DNA-binding protein n=1 Tax=Mycobacterium sp. ACS4331 TaxID=1834121 RepID=UPI0007FC74C2|nr:sigma factor-like helix-turn-helix DNA-binding protein [Mycobacterium sp. ACS4331]OBF20011.1 hypothetical protein A5727_09675 [Mycobacterium sp. ACS4331]
MSLSEHHGAADPNGRHEIPAGQRAPDQTLMAAAVEHLSPEHRALLRRSFYEHSTTEQIATECRIAEEAVRARLHFALRELRAIVQEMVTEATPPAPQVQPSSMLRTVCPRRWVANLTGGPRPA